MSYESQSQIHDLTGKRFGKLIVLGRGKTITKVRKSKNRSDRNRNRNYWMCKCDCGGIKECSRDTLKQGLTRSCGCMRIDRAKNMVGPKHPSWKGGRHKDDNGYIRINVGPSMQRMEHCVIMEKYLGRELFEDETVHHVNGIKDDNRIENLELWASNHASGQRVSDLLKWANQIIEKYKNTTL